MNNKRKSKRGFASMTKELQRKIASQGGASVPPEKRSFSQDHDLATTAGRLGGGAVAPENRTFSKNRELASKAGRLGGLARGHNLKNV